MSKNESLAQILDEIARMMEVLGEDSFRASANARAARTIADLPTPIEQLAKDRPALLQVPGIGKAIADKVIEFCSSGKVHEHEELRGRVPPGVLALMQIPGVGPKTARVMWVEGKIDSVAKLEGAIRDGSILTLPRMGEKSVEKIRQSIAFAKQSRGRLWLGQADAIARIFVERLSGQTHVREVVAAGSLRRGKETIGDVDILVAIDDAPRASRAQAPGAGAPVAKGARAKPARATPTDERPGHVDPAIAGPIAERFRSTPGVTQVLVAGETKSSVRFAHDHDTGRWTLEGAEGHEQAGAVQVDLRVLPASSFGAALMYFTGSKEHNVRLRERALAMGFTLNEWGLFGDDDPDKSKPPPQERGVAPVAGATEEGVYETLGLPWIPPEAREDRGELEAKSPWRLVELADIKAELHAHTTASDGSMSIVELAGAAKARGFHTIAVTDHSKSSIQANGLSVDRLLAHVDAVHAARAKVRGITILAGSEVDILADGTLDYPDAVLAKLDIVIASPHTALSQDPEAATKRLLAAIAHPRVHILGHPTGRLINRRPGLSPDVGALVAAAEKARVALEINSHWMRLDLRDQHVRAARDGLIAINCDVHEPGDFDNLRYGVMTARRGWLTPDRCVNTWSAARLHDWLESKRA